MDLVSAIITTCKREPSIVKRALMSVIKQTYENIEIIVVDDSPEDYVYRDDIDDMIRDVEQSSNRKIIYIRHQTCLGANAARNTGLHRSNGRFVGYLDDDDEWLPHKIERMIGSFEDERVGIVYGNYEVLRSDADDPQIVRLDAHNGMAYDSLIYKNYIGGASFPLLRKEALERADGFDIRMQAAQDYDMWLRISLLYEVRYVDEVLNRYYIHAGEQITKNPQKRINGLEMLNEKNREYLETHKQAYWIRYMKMIPIYVNNNDRKKAFNTWIKCVKKCPLRFFDNLKYLYKVL